MKTSKILVGILAIATALATQIQAQSFLTNGLVAYYPFNGNANDASGNGNDGTVQAATPATNRFGVPNTAYYFNGTNAVVTVPDSAFNNLSQGTIATWIELAANDQEAIFGKEDDGANSYGIFTVGSYSNDGGGPTAGTPGTLYFHARNGAPLVSSTTLLATGAWYHVAVVFSTTNCVLYVNGVTAGAASGYFGIPYDTASVTAIGAWQDKTGLFALLLDGTISDFRIYSIALTASEVGQLYAQESPNFPQITQDLTNFYALYGQSASLSVEASGAAPLTYQWYSSSHNGGGPAGAYAEVIAGFVYGAVVTNGGYGYGNVPLVSFVGGGGNGASGFATVSNGLVTGITVTNAGTGYTNAPGVVFSAPNGFLYGQTNRTLTINQAGTNNLGNYYVTVSNSSGSVTSSVVSLTLLYPPAIINNPVGFIATNHASGTLSVTAAGTPPFAYQWFLNGTSITNATNSTYAIVNLNTNLTGNYYVQVVSPYGYANSGTAAVEMQPSLTAPFTGAVGLWGQNTVLSVGAVGSGSLNYQWYFNGLAIPGATSSSYALNSIQFTNAGLYGVVVSSSYGSVTNAAYQVVVNPADTGIGTCPIIYITGTVGYSYAIQSTTNLADTNAWITVTNITLSAPSIIWPDTATDTSQPANPRKFYRVIPGQ